MLRYQGVIFDMDGVLCRTDRLHYQAWVQFTEKYGLPFSEELNDRIQGRGRIVSMDMVLGEWGKTLSPEEKQRLILEKNDLFLALADRLTPGDAVPGVPETLSALRALGLRLALGSSSRNARLVMEKLRLSAFMDAWVDGTEVQACKPAPDIFLAAAKKLGLAPTDCLVVEDAEAGVEAALRGGFSAAGIGPASADARCRHRLSCFSDLLKAVSLEE